MWGRFGFEVAFGLLAFVGLWVTVDKAAAGILRVWGWWRCDRREPVEVDTEACAAQAPDGDRCWFDGGHEGLHSWSQRLELPPEQSAADLGFGRVPFNEADLWPDDFGGLIRGRHLEELRERRAPWWEAEHRAAYQALGFDYPSGLMARVRELTP